MFYAITKRKTLFVDALPVMSLLLYTTIRALSFMLYPDVSFLYPARNVNSSSVRIRFVLHVRRGFKSPGTRTKRERLGQQWLTPPLLPRSVVPATHIISSHCFYYSLCFLSPSFHTPPPPFPICTPRPLLFLLLISIISTKPHNLAPLIELSSPISKAPLILFHVHFITKSHLCYPVRYPRQGCIHCSLISL